MKKTLNISISLTYDNVDLENLEVLKQAVQDEAMSWVESGSFGDDLYYDADDANLVDYETKVRFK